MNNSIKNLLILSVLVFGALSFNLKIVKGDWNFDRSGNLIFTQNVLGEEDQNVQDTKTTTPEVKKIEVNTETNTQDRVENSNTVQKKDDSKVSLPTGAPEKEIKNENIEKLDVSVNENNKLKVEIKTKDNKTIDSEQDSFKIGDLKSDNEIKISSSESKGDFDVEKNNVKATVGFPISINPITKALVVSTPNGDKTVTILPDRAASIAALLKIVDNAGAASKIQMVSHDNELVYEVDGNKSEKLLGLLPVKIKKTVNVSTQTGSVISVNEDLFNKLLDLISF